MHEWLDVASLSLAVCQVSIRPFDHYAVFQDTSSFTMHHHKSVRPCISAVIATKSNRAMNTAGCLLSSE